MNILAHSIAFYGNEVHFSLWDVGAQEYFKRFRKTYYIGALAAFIVFDVCNRNSFANVKVWYKELEDFLEEKSIPIVIVGNKIDIVDRKVTIDDGKERAGYHKYYDVSTKSCHNIDKPFLHLAKRLKNSGIHVEITNLIISDLNDSDPDIESLSNWIVDNLGDDTPTHFSAYHPDFKQPSMKRTPFETLDRAYNIAKKEGINYVYVGNISHEKGINTYCPNCNHLILGRSGYRFTKINITDSKKCPNCQYDLSKDIKGEVNRKTSHRLNFF